MKQGSIATPAAYTVTSHGSLSLQNTKYSFSGSGSLDRDLSILQENLNGIVNGSAVTFAVHPSGGNFVIEISADGRSYRNSLNRPAQTVFFPDFDLAAYDILLNLAARHPGTPISALIPKQTGILSTATLAPQADVQGTLNGKALTLHHILAHHWLGSKRTLLRLPTIGFSKWTFPARPSPSSATTSSCNHPLRRPPTRQSVRVSHNKLPVRRPVEIRDVSTSTSASIPYGF